MAGKNRHHLFTGDYIIASLILYIDFVPLAVKKLGKLEKWSDKESESDLSENLSD